MLPSLNAAGWRPPPDCDAWRPTRECVGATPTRMPHVHTMILALSLATRIDWDGNSLVATFPGGTRSQVFLKSPTEEAIASPDHVLFVLDSSGPNLTEAHSAASAAPLTLILGDSLSEPAGRFSSSRIELDTCGIREHLHELVQITRRFRRRCARAIARSAHAAC